LLQGFARGGKVATAGGAEGSNGVELRGQVEMDGLGFVPVGGDLQDGGTAETAMGEEHFFAEGIFSGSGDDFGGEPRQLGIAMMIGGIENERDQSGARGNNLVAELASEVVAEGGGAHFGDGEPASGDDQDRSAKLGGFGAKDEFRGTLNFGDTGVNEDLDPGSAALGFEEVDDVRGGIVAEKLAVRFFVVGDAMLFEESDEIRGSEPGESRFGEVRIRREKIFGSGVEIGEVAATTAGNEDFLADAVSVLE
jgi:hypothetical protein